MQWVSYHILWLLTPQGDFELALLFFHRGNKLRADLSEFRIGVQKAREAIENSIGEPDALKACRHRVKGMESIPPVPEPSNQSKDRTAMNLGSALTPSMESRLLGELYEDKVYLAELALDPDFAQYPDPHVNRLVAEGLQFMTTRIEFWKQQVCRLTCSGLTRLEPAAAQKAHCALPVD
jgi:hypothetical protein